MADEETVRKVLERLFEFAGADVERAEELYHEDAVLEFPQSGERFEGRATFTDWRSQYPVGVDDMRYRILRHTVREDFSATELTASYDRGESWMYGVQLLDFRDDKVIRERIYVAEGWEAPEWRAKWRAATPSDPLGLISSSTPGARDAHLHVVIHLAAPHLHVLVNPGGVGRAV